MGMYEPSLTTWILIGFGSVTIIPLLYAQLILLLYPQSQTARDLIIGKGEQWRDHTHFKSAIALAWADWIFFLPLFIAAVTGLIRGQIWGYACYAICGAVQVYINVFLWVFEKEYVYPAVGPLAYYTYIWGNFMAWGIATFIYSILRLTGF
jgi:hypothetical protein